MAYCTVEEIQGMFNPSSLKLSETSNPKASQVALWILQVEAEVDSRLAARYQTPITGATALQITKTICTNLVASKTWYQSAGNAPNVSPTARGAMLEKEANDLLDLYTGKDGDPPKASLPGAVAIVAAPAVLGPSANYTDANGNAPTRFFTRGQVF